jgi:hypothetical protein
LFNVTAVKPILFNVTAVTPIFRNTCILLFILYLYNIL